MIEWIKKHKSSITTMTVIGLVFLGISFMCFFEWNDDVLGIGFATICTVFIVNIGKHFMDSGGFDKIYEWQNNHLTEGHEKPSVLTPRRNIPLTIRPEGKVVLKESGAQDYLDEKFDSWYNKFDKIDSPYYIQKKQWRL